MLGGTSNIIVNEIQTIQENDIIFLNNRMNKKQNLLVILTILSVVAVLLFYTVPRLRLCRVSRNIKVTGYKTICLSNYEEFIEGHLFDSKTPITTPTHIYQTTAVYSLVVILAGGLIFFLLKEKRQKVKGRHKAGRD